MTVESQPFVSALGRSCTVYVEHENAELYAPSQEHLIVAGGGTVTRDPDNAAAVVVIKRGVDKIESRVTRMWALRQADPWTQGVVDVDWVNDCIKRSELQGPPEWGGYLLAPQESTISGRAAHDAVSAVFGGHVIRAECQNTPSIVTESSEPARPGAADEPPRSNPPRSDRGSSRERGRPGPSPNVAWKRVEQIVKKEIDPAKLRLYTQGDMLDLILFLSQKEAESQTALWQDFAREKAKNSEEPNRQKNAWQNFYGRHRGVIDKCVDIMRSADQSSGNLRQLRDASSSRGPRRSQSRGSGYKTAESDPESDEDTVRTRSRRSDSQGSRLLSSRSDDDNYSQGPREKRSVNASRVQPKLNQGKLTDMATERRKGSRYRKSGSATYTRYTPEDTLAVIKLFAKSTDEDLLNEKLPPVWKEMRDAFIRERTASNPTRALRAEPKVWTRWVQHHWDVIAAGAIALKAKPYVQANGVQAQLSMTAGSHTPADFDEMADFITKQIKFRRVPERKQKEAMGQAFVWKAFAIVYRTNRSWKEWQEYYNQKAEDINRAARLRLKPRSQSGSLPAESLLPRIEAQMALRPSSSGYPSPPVSRVPLKRALDAPTDGQRPKHIRPN